MTDENVINMPTRLERLAKGIKEALATVKENRSLWIENLMSAAAQLLEAREAFKEDKAFGQWLSGNDINLNHQDRAALIAMARKPVTMKGVLAETDRTSPHHIYAQYRGRFTQVGKPTGPPRPQPAAKAKPTQRRMDPATPRPQEDKARAAVRARTDAGIAFDARELGKELGISHVLVEQAAAVERAVEEYRRENEILLDPEGMSATAQQKFAAIKARMERNNLRQLAAWRATLDEEVRQRVLKETADRLEYLKERQAETTAERQRYYERNNDFKPIYSETEWTTIYRVCHPDNSASEDMRSRAFNLVRDKKLQLTGKK